MKFSAEVTIDLFEDKALGLLKFNLIKGDFRKFEGSWKIQKIKNTFKNSLIYDLTVQGCQWMPIGMIEKRLKKDLSENLIAVDRQAKSSIIN
jgi:ribosome-associated toxin RatA of RatAB toxin-antitoxin module